MRIIPEEFVRSTPGDFEHRVVFSVRWGNSWQLWLERDKKDLFMIEEDWDEFVDDNQLGPNDNLFFRHDNTMFHDVKIFNNGAKEIISFPLEVKPETEPHHPRPQKSHREKTTASASASANGGTGGRVSRGYAHVKNPERYLLNPENPFYVQAVTKRNDVLYVSRPVVQKYGLKFGPVKSTINYLLPGGENRESLP